MLKMLKIFISFLIKRVYSSIIICLYNYILNYILTIDTLPCPVTRFPTNKTYIIRIESLTVNIWPSSDWICSNLGLFKRLRFRLSNGI